MEAARDADSGADRRRSKESRGLKLCTRTGRWFGAPERPWRDRARSDRRARADARPRHLVRADWSCAVVALTARGTAPATARRRRRLAGGFPALDEHHLLAPREVLLEVQQVLGVEGGAVEVSRAAVLSLHH